MTIKMEVSLVLTENVPSDFHQTNPCFLVPSLLPRTAQDTYLQLTLIFLPNQPQDFLMILTFDHLEPAREHFSLLTK